jgi:hypothetical protein
MHDGMPNGCCMCMEPLRLKPLLLLLDMGNAYFSISATSHPCSSQTARRLLSPAPTSWPSAAGMLAASAPPPPLGQGSQMVPTLPRQTFPMQPQGQQLQPPSAPPPMVQQQQQQQQQLLKQAHPLPKQGAYDSRRGLHSTSPHLPAFLDTALHAVTQATAAMQAQLPHASRSRPLPLQHQPRLASEEPLPSFNQQLQQQQAEAEPISTSSLQAVPPQQQQPQQPQQASESQEQPQSTSTAAGTASGAPKAREKKSAAPSSSRKRVALDPVVAEAQKYVPVPATLPGIVSLPLQH